MDQNRAASVSAWIGAIVVLLLVWGSFIAWGALRTQSRLDLRKPSIILGSIAIFVLVWVALLMTKKKKLKRNDQTDRR